MDLRDILDNLEDGNDTKLKDDCATLSKVIQENKSTILDLIENLCPLLTNSEVSKRQFGLSIINEVLKSISINLLNAKQLEVLADFYISKLKDHHQLLPSTLSGLLILIGFENFPSSKIPTLLSSIFHNVPCQQQQRGDRYTIFQIFDVSCSLFRQDVQNMKLEFVYGVLQAVDGERDPKNLLFLFNWMKKFLSDFQMYHLTEDIFDVLACYFPVDFKRPPNENSITRENLAKALSLCLCANPEFGESCIALALEKLDSSLEISKVDSLKLLRDGCSTLTESVYLENFSKIWSLIQREIFTNTSNQVKSESLITLQAITGKISNESHLNEIKDMLDTIKGNLLPDSKLFTLTTQILIHVAAGSEKASKLVAKEMIPTLINVYKMSAYIDHKCTIVKTLVDLIKEYVKYNKSLIDQEIPDLVGIPHLCLELLNMDENSYLAFDCLEALVPYLTLDVRNILYPKLKVFVLSNTSELIEQSFNKCLKSVATYYPDEVQNQLFKSVPQLSLWGPFLRSKSQLITLNYFTDSIIEDYLEGIKKEETFKVTIDNVKILIENNKDNNDLLKKLIEKNLLNAVVELVLKFKEDDPEFLQNISLILTTLLANQSEDLQKDILDKYYQIILKNIYVNESCFVVFFGLLAPLKTVVPLNYETLQVVFSFTLDNKNNFIKNLGMQLMGNLVNKYDNGADLNNFLQNISYFENSNEFSENKFELLCFITKGLILKNHPEGNKWLDLVLIKIQQYSNCVKNAINIIINDIYEAFSDRFHCKRMFLYKQKTFNYMVESIIKFYNDRSHNDASKAALLSGIAYLCEYVPLQVVMLKFKTVSPFLLLCMDQQDAPEVLYTVSLLLRNICMSDNEMLKSDFGLFLKKILSLTRHELLRVRMESLKCLTLFATSYPELMLLPYKSEVLKELLHCVDDKKRLVRKEAMEARSLWYILGQ